MYRWYANSQCCYAYLHDLDTPVLPTKRDAMSSSGGWPEFIAPREVLFMHENWDRIGDKRSLASTLHGITQVQKHILRRGQILRDGMSSNRPCAAQIISWAADRKTTREEDRAYSLLGLLGVNMSILYGEGKEAFHRIQVEIIRISTDHSLFAWDPEGRIRRPGSVLADDPSYFRDCHDVVEMEPNKFIRNIKQDATKAAFTYSKSSGRHHDLALGNVDKSLRTFTVTNGGIQIWLPLTPYRDSPDVFRATLACHKDGMPMTVDFAAYKSNYYRYFGAIGPPKETSEFRQLYLASQDETLRDFTLVYNTIPFCGFSRCGTFPRPISGNSFALSATNDLMVVVYANHGTNARFAVAFGHYFGQEWAHIICEQPPRNGIWNRWQDFARQVCDQMQGVAPEHARHMAEACLSKPSLFYTKHGHFPRSVSAARVICSSLRRSSDCTIMVDIVQCSGCCAPIQWKALLVGPFYIVTCSSDYLLLPDWR
ncbi:hypothetical protein ID866_9405 [Astraeus odoratus]|nr:hypothetical protein ID866_9405 [Astraeus odoratus]